MSENNSNDPGKAATGDTLTRRARELLAKIYCIDVARDAVADISITGVTKRNAMNSLDSLIAIAFTQLGQFVYADKYFPQDEKENK